MPADYPQSPDWTGLLMAGGASRRMGRDKARLMFDGEPLWQRQWRTLREAGVGRVMIARGRQPWTEVEGLERVDDAEPECGPLGGLVGALRRMETRWMLVLAVDVPRMEAAVLQGMMGQAERAGRGLVPVIKGRFEPLAAVYPRACLAVAEEALQARELALQGFVTRCVEAVLVGRMEVGSGQCAFFRNVNEPADLAGEGPAQSVSAPQ